MTETHRSQRGFTLIEATVATALTCAVVLGICSAVVSTLRANATLAERAGLADDALNVLSDLRVATAYDADAPRAPRPAARRTQPVVRNGKTLAIVVNVGAGGAGTPIVAHVTGHGSERSNGDRNAATLRRSPRHRDP